MTKKKYVFLALIKLTVGQGLGLSLTLLEEDTSMQEAQTPSSFHTLMWETHEAQHEMSSEQQILRKKKEKN